MRCRPDTCTWDRNECNYCGDGIVDGPELIDLLPDEESDPERDDCDTFVAADNENPCCVMAGQPCAPQSSGYQCCYAYAHPDEEACEATALVDNTFEFRCRPTTPG